MIELQKYGPVVLRISISLVFLWFSISQFMAPDEWIGYLPDFLASTSQPLFFIYANATVELVLGILLIIGFFTRVVALLLSIHLLSITIALGYNAIAVRDLGLTLATFSIFLNGPDAWCLKK